MKEWAAFFSGDYDGRFCNPPGDWEDLIGVVTLECVPHKKDLLKFTLKSIEISGWKGTLQVKDKVLTVFTDTKKSFDLVFSEGPDGRGGTFVGKFRPAKGPPVTEMRLTMRRPSQRPE